MRIFDAHLHLNKRSYCGRGRLDQLEAEMKKNGVERGLLIADFQNTSYSHATLELAKHIGDHPRLKLAAGIDAETALAAQLKRYKALVLKRRIAAFKLYPGYQYFYPGDRKLDALYRLAEKLKIPVIIHCGDVCLDMSSKPPLLKYTHPLHVDEAATRFPRVKFIIAHAGNPWMMDCAEVMYKNSNVYADLSGLAVMTLSKANKRDLRKRLKEMFDYLDGTGKFIFGSDWPLIDLKTYISFFKTVIPRAGQKAFFCDTAKRLFR